VKVAVRRQAVGVAVIAVSVGFGVFLVPGTASAKVLGDPDFAGYCRWLHGGNDLYGAGPGDPGNPNSWKCNNLIDPLALFTEDVDATTACQWKYGANASATNSGNPWSWQCEDTLTEQSAENTTPAAVTASTWHGSWTGGNGRTPADLSLSSIDPIRGSINVGDGYCTADWTEVQRNSDTSRVVNAHVTSGPCIDNTWNVTITSNSIAATDPAHPQGTFTASRS
jgi:hypothetical protein